MINKLYFDEGEGRGEEALIYTEVDIWWYVRSYIFDERFWWRGAVMVFGQRLDGEDVVVGGFDRNRGLCRTIIFWNSYLTFLKQSTKSSPYIVKRWNKYSIPTNLQLRMRNKQQF